MLKKVRGLRKFSCRPVASQTGELLAPRHQERQVRKFNFLCGLCAEIFRVLDAAQPALGSQSFEKTYAIHCLEFGSALRDVLVIYEIPLAAVPKETFAFARIVDDILRESLADDETD